MTEANPAAAASPNPDSPGRDAVSARQRPGGAPLGVPAGTAAQAAAHSRLHRAILSIYVVTAAVALTGMTLALVSNRASQENALRDRVLLATHMRAQSLSAHLDLLVRELTRLGLRSEVDLLDENLEPERTLLRLAHDQSTFFNVGVAILTAEGVVAWSEPVDFLSPGTSFAGSRWIDAVRRQRVMRIVPVRPERDDALLYLVSPIYRSERFAGALLGAIDLAQDRALAGDTMALGGSRTVLATVDGTVVYPPRPPEFAGEPAWQSHFSARTNGGTGVRLRLAGRDHWVAQAPVPGTDLVLLAVSDPSELYAPARYRFWIHLGIGLSLAVVPLLLLVVLLRRSLQRFQAAEGAAVQAERLQTLGEAANLIAHEVKNALNGIRLGLDVVLRQAQGREGPSQRVVDGLRKEVHRLSDFTTELLVYSKGVNIRAVSVEIGAVVRNVSELLSGVARDRGIEVAVSVPDQPLIVPADPSLVHVVVSNLLSNALDALAGSERIPRRVSVDVVRRERWGEVRLADTGPGIAPDVRSRLFEPFVTGKPSGVGIGLAISRKIARAHGGDLVVEDPQRGASFVLRLPLERAAGSSRKSEVR